VARPAHVDDVAALLSWAMRHRLALIPRGAGTGMPGGNTGPGVALDLGAFDAGPHLEDDGTALRAGAAVVAADADRAARSVGRHLPALPSSAAWCTLGGMVANDAAGARSFAHGPVHAWLREVTWVRADGTVETLTRDTRASRALRAALPPTTSPWPAVRKNSSGYGLDRFITAGHRPLHLVPASEGTLGIVTEVVIETEPLPAATGVALVGLGALDDLAGVAEVAADLGAAACEYFGRRLVELGSLRDDPRLSGLDVEAGLALLEFSGSADTVQAGLAAAVRLGGSLGGAVHADDPAEAEQLWALRHAASPTIARAAEAGRRSLQFIEDAVVPPARVGDYARAVTGVLDRYGTDGVIFGHLGDGNLHVNPLVDLTDARWRHRVRGILGEVTDVVAGLGGTLAGEHGDGRLRAPLLSRIWAPDQVAAFAALKDHFDPGGILNPGVVLPLPGQDPLDGFAAGLESA
jgi:FAD/FMN-containing dehydrogenase